MFNTNLQSMRQIGEEPLYVLEAFNKQIAMGSIDPLGFRVQLQKIARFFCQIF